jgi:hypothetical protein
VEREYIKQQLFEIKMMEENKKRWRRKALGQTGYLHKIESRAEQQNKSRRGKTEGRAAQEAKDTGG